MKATPRHNESDDGFTLVELLVVIVITSIIMSVIATAFIVGADTISSANTRLQESHDAQLASAFFIADAETASSFSTTRPSDSTCPDAVAPDTDVALFEWTDSGSGKLKDAFYVLTSAPRQLHRRYCEASRLISDVTLAKTLSTDPTQAPAVSCPPPAALPCGTQPADVQLQVWEASGYSYNLRATRRTARSAGGALDGISAYVGGGGIVLAGGGTVVTTAGVVDVNSANITCAGLSTPAGLAGNPSSKCGATATNPMLDPLAAMAAPAAAPAAPMPVGGGIDARFGDGQSLGVQSYLGQNYNAYRSVSAGITGADVGKTVTGAGIPLATTITTVLAPYFALSNPVGADSGGDTFTVVERATGAPTMTPCGFKGRYYQAGTYTTSITPKTRGCLATGTYHLPSGADLSNVTAQGTFTDGRATRGHSRYVSKAGAAAFTSADVGKTIVGVDVPTGATIVAVVNATTITLSAAATASASGLTYSILSRDSPLTDGVATRSSNQYRSATAIFTVGAVGKAIVGTDIPAGTTITSVSGPTSVTLSNAATGSGSALTFTIPNRSGVLIHLAAGSLTLGPVNLAPVVGPVATTLQAGVTVFMNRTAGSVTAAGSATVNGILYAPNGALSLTAGVHVTAGAVDVQALTLAAGATLTLP